MNEMQEEPAEFDRRVKVFNGKIRALFRSNELCLRIGMIEGIGPITATVLAAAVGNGLASKMAAISLHCWGLCLARVPEAESLDCRASASAVIVAYVFR